MVKLAILEEKIHIFSEDYKNFRPYGPETLKKCTVRIWFFIEIRCTVRVRFGSQNLSDQVPPRVRISSDAQKNVKSFLVSSSFKKLIIPFAFAANNPTWNKKLKHDFLEKRHQLINIETNHTAKMKSFDVFSDFLFQIKKVTSST